MEKYGLIGKTLVHSYSKEIHETLGRYTYDLFSLAEDEVAGFIDKTDFGGLNVTIPYKQDVIPLCDEVSELAAAIGAVNTLYFAPAGPDEPGRYGAGRKLVGHNTDYEGFLYAAKRADIGFSAKNVLILGTGGTSLMARKAAADQGAARIFIASRSSSPKNADSAAAAACGCEITHLTYPELADIADDIDIIVNTTPVGTFPNNMQSIIELSDFPHCEAAMDVIYNPFRTKLLLDAQRLGIRHTNGLPMLVAQATAAAGYFLGTPGAFYSENERIISKLKSQMENIVLIGMPGCGKSTIGRILAEKTGKAFVDTDDEIIERAGMPIPEIFERFGERHFRDLESETALALGSERGLVIATGGGALLRPQNIDALRQNGTIIHITRPVSSLPTDGRPLSTDTAALEKMEAERLPLYQAAADITFDNSKILTEKELKAAADVICKEVLNHD